MSSFIIKDSNILQKCDSTTTKLHKNSPLFNSVFSKQNNENPNWSFDGKTVFAKCVKVHDCNIATFSFIPYSNSNVYSFKCLLTGYTSNTITAKNRLSDIMLNHIVKLELGPFDNSGNILVNVYLLCGFHVNSYMSH